MQPFFDSLSLLLEASSKAILTIVGREGCAYTRPMGAVPAPFRGYLWLRAGADQTPIDKIGRGAEVSVAYGRSESGPFVTMSGWAIVLRHTRHAKSVAQATPHPARAAQQDLRPLVCVMVRAAQMWDTGSARRPRVFAFSHAEPAFVEDSLDFMPELPARADYARAAALEHAW